MPLSIPRTSHLRIADRPAFGQRAGAADRGRRSRSANLVVLLLEDEELAAGTGFMVQLVGRAQPSARKGSTSAGSARPRGAGQRAASDLLQVLSSPPESRIRTSSFDGPRFLGVRALDATQSSPRSDGHAQCPGGRTFHRREPAQGERAGGGWRGSWFGAPTRSGSRADPALR